MGTVLLVTQSFPPDTDDAARHAFRVAQHIKALGYEVQVSCLDRSRSLHDLGRVTVEKMSCLRYGTGDDTARGASALWQYLADDIMRDGVTLIHAYHATAAGFIATNLGRAFNRPSVVTVAGPELYLDAFDSNAFAQLDFTLRRASRLLVTTREQSIRIRAIMNRQDLVYCPAAVDGARYRAEAAHRRVLRERLLIDPEAVVLLAVGEATHESGFDTLLEAFEEVVELAPEVVLLLCGRQNELLASWLGALQGRNDKAAARVRVLPQMPPMDMIPMYGMVDIAVIPSFFAGMPNVLMESMACEKVVIATGCGGMIDVIQNEETGFLVPQRHPAALAETIVRAIDLSVEERQALGEKARQHVLKAFGMGRERKTIGKVYDQLESVK